MYVGLTLSCLSQTCYCVPFWFPEGPSQSQLISPLWAGVFECGNLFYPSTPSPGVMVLPVSSFLFFFHHPTWLHGDFSCPYRCPRSSTSVQQVLCENCSICRCILDVLVRGGKLHILLFCHLDPSSSFFFVIWWQLLAGCFDSFIIIFCISSTHFSILVTMRLT